MSALESWGFDLGDFGGSDQFDTALTFGTGSTMPEYTTADSVASDAIRASLPVQANTPNEWGGFLRDTLKTVVGYSIAKDAAQSGVRVPTAATYVPVQQQPAPLISGQLLLLLGVGAVVYLIAKN